jgi:hypothetical protein
MGRQHGLQRLEQDTANHLDDRRLFELRQFFDTFIRHCLPIRSPVAPARKFTQAVNYFIGSLEASPQGKTSRLWRHRQIG